MDNSYIKDLVNNQLAGLGYITEVDSFELVYMNKALVKRLNLTDDSYKGKKCYEFIHGYSEPCGYCKQRFAKYDEFYKWYYFNEKHDIHFSIKEKLIKTDEKNLHLIISLDITNEVLQEEEMLKLSTLDEGIIRCVKQLINEKDTNFAINALLKMVCDFYDGCRAYIFEIDHVKTIRSCTYSYSDEGLPPLTEVAINIPFDYSSQWANYLMELPYFYSNDLKSDFDESEGDFYTLNGGGVDSMLNIPLIRYGVLAGYIGVDNPHNYDNNHELLATIAAFILNIIDKQRALVELQLDKDRKENTFQVGETLIDCAKSLLNDTKDADTSIVELLKTICAYYDSDCSYIFEWDRQTKLVSNTYEHISKNNFDVDDLYDISDDLIDSWFDTIEEKGALIILSCDEELDHSSEEYLLLVSNSIESIVLVPLMKDNNVIGALGIDNLTKNKDNTALLHTLSGFIMNYIQKRDLIKELEHLSFTDKLTGLCNRNFYLSEIEEMKETPPTNLGVIFADVNGLKKANDKLGHEYGDILLKWCANFLKENLSSSISRIGGDEFVVFVKDTEQSDFDACISDMRKALKKMPHINMSIGSTWHKDEIDVDKQIIETDKMMYMEKQRYYAIVKERNLSQEQEIANLKEAIQELKVSLS